ncbi:MULTISPECIES: hypothetical protein [Tenacibaculum]|uniref:hypothetical protein n=1 Tax=Tenacibaculum TaxID=104267 RepID=UPI001F0B57EF|nr:MULTISPECIES: hypothetical protein [Tenacibaculum]MCH3880850.1 hypothetical protein [Tenacibaculum aquimarinum]MDO6599551.1 hypothetical protein [Tenacibaculum sp. 1_MG-2023]
MIKKIIYLIFLFLAINAFSQEKSINNYKYIIIPTQFEWLSSPDKHQVNSLTKFLFKKYGFTAFLSDEKLPSDLSINRCLALTANVKNSSKMLSIANFIELKDCSNNVIFTSIEGKSKSKDYKKAYQEAIRNAFVSVKNLNYNYQPLKDETEVKEVLPPIVNPGVKVVPEKEIELKEETKEIEENNVLYAQKKSNGFQLVNTKPAIVFQILKSSKKDFFFIKNLDGVFFKNGNNWIAEYYKNGQLVQKTYQIKF